MEPCLGKKEENLERESRGKSSKTTGNQVQHQSLLRTQSLSPSIGRKGVNQEVEIDPIMIKSSRQASPNFVDFLPPQHNKVESHRRAAAATASGKFRDEIIPVSTKLYVFDDLSAHIVDPKTGAKKPVIVSVGDGIRPNANLSDLTKEKPAFKTYGSTTAGNASQVRDGAEAVFLMKRSVAMQKGLPILGVFRSFAAVGVDPAVMGIGPAVAVPTAVKSTGLELGDINLFEINVAFAYQFVYCLKKLKLDPKKVNVNGGAIVLGHPLGATGAHCIANLLNEMKRQGKDYCFGVISMCIGGRVERCSSSHLCEQTETYNIRGTTNPSNRVCRINLFKP